MEVNILKIDKKLLFSSLFIILLLAVGAVSASDSDDILSASVASSDIDELAIDAEIDNANSDVNDKLNNVLVNSEENDDVSTINPNNEEINDNISSENNVSGSVETIVTAHESSYGEDILGNPATVNIQNIINNPNIASIPGFQGIIDTLNGIGNKNGFDVQKMVDLLKNLGNNYNVNIPAITDALNEISKKYNVNPSNLIAALNELEANYNLNAKDIVDSLNTFASDNLNVAQVINALTDISDKYNIGLSDLIGTLDDLDGKYNLDPSAVIAALITLNNNPDLNVKDVVDALNSISGLYGFEVPNFIADLGNLAEKYNFDVADLTDALNGLADINNMNIPDLADALRGLAEKYSFDAFDLASALSGISGKYNLNVSQLAGVLDNLADKYDLNVSDLAATLNALAEKYSFDASDLAALSNLAKKYNFDVADLAAALSDLAGKYNFDVADLVGVLDNLAGKYNVSDLIVALSTLAEKYNLDVSQIENALKDILDSISSDEPKLNSLFIAPTRIISVANGISGYDYKFILKDEYGLPIANRDVMVVFNGKTQTVKTDKDGWGTVTIHGNTAGEYIMLLTFMGDKNNNPSYKTATIKLIKEKTMFIAPDRAVYVQQMARGYKYSAILKDQNGNPLANKKVLFIIDGKKVVGVTDEKGWATVTLNAVTVGAQTLTIKFAGTATCYYETSLTRTIKIVREQSRLTVPDKVYSASSNAKKVTATLLSKSGNPIYGAKVFLNVDGKTYVAVTNNLGIATFSINLAKIGVFTATTRFDDSRFFAATATKSKITIN